MKESQKKGILAGAVGVAAGVAGTVGATELNDYLKEEEKAAAEGDATASAEQNAQPEVQQQPASASQHPAANTHQEPADEIVPVASDMSAAEVATPANDIQTIDVDPDEIAQAIVEDAEPTDEVLLAMNDGKQEQHDSEDDAFDDVEDIEEGDDDTNDDDPDADDSLGDIIDDIV